MDFPKKEVQALLDYAAYVKDAEPLRALSQNF